MIRLRSLGKFENMKIEDLEYDLHLEYFPRVEEMPLSIQQETQEQVIVPDQQDC